MVTEEQREYQRAYYSANRERLRELARRRYAANPETQRGASRRWQKQHPEKVREKARRQNARMRPRALLRIAKRWGDSEPRCRPDTLPNDHPLRFVPCFGRLEIDHMKGGGYVEAKSKSLRGRRLYQKIAQGKRGVHDLRLLCTLHNLWNHPDDPKLRMTNGDNRLDTGFPSPTRL
jgi:hypothetical protein